MNMEQLRAEHPELVAAIEAEAREGMVTAEDHEAALAAARSEGAAAENRRIAECRAQALPGHEELVETMAFDGKSTAADVALAIVTAEKGRCAQAAADLAADANPAVPPTDDDASGPQTMKRAEFEKLSHAERHQLRASGVKLID